MINLIKNEITKILKKKSLYITLLVTLAFIILTNVLYQYEPDFSNDYIDENIAYYEKELKELDYHKASDKSTYAEIKSELEITKLMKQYGGYDTWQGEIINNRISSYIREINYYEYGVEEDTQGELQELKQTYENLLKRLENDDWKAFALEEQKDLTEELKQQKELKAQTIDKNTIEQIKDTIQTLEIQKQVVDWRIEKNISYASGYFNDALNTYENGSMAIQNYQEENSQEDYNEKLNYYETLKNTNIAKYDIEYETTAGETTDARGILLNVFGEYEIFIIIMIVMIAGAIVSEEFNKGTVKLLLIKPYKRTTILTAKLLTCFIMLFVIILLVVGMQFVVGGIVSGFDSYQTPAVVYNYNTNQIQELNIVTYLALVALGKLPIYILLMTLAFAISTLFSNTALSIAITLLGYMGSSVINLLAIQFKIELLKFFVTPNWDLTQYLFGGLPSFQYVSLPFSIIINIAYFIIMLIPTYVVFKKKNIKNI